MLLLPAAATAVDLEEMTESHKNIDTGIDSMGFPDCSVGKESASNAGNPSLIPGLGRSAGEGIGYPLQYSWASLVTQLVKNLSAVWVTWVRSVPGLGGSAGEGNGYPLQYSAWRIPWTV